MIPQTKGEADAPYTVRPVTKFMVYCGDDAFCPFTSEEEAQALADRLNASYAAGMAPGPNGEMLEASKLFPSVQSRP